MYSQKGREEVKQNMDEFDSKEKSSLRFAKMREKARVKRLVLRESRKETLEQKKEIIKQKKVEIKEKNVEALTEHNWLQYAWRIVTYPFKMLWMLICGIFNIVTSIFKHCGELIFLILEVLFSALS